MAGLITDLADAGALDGEELLEVSKPSATVAITAATLSVDDADNSLNDSGSGFVAAGFAEGDGVTISGFATGANNLLFGQIESLTAAKMVISAPDGDLLVTEAAGASVTIAKWESKRTSSSGVGGTAGGGDVAIEDDGLEIVAAASRLNFTGAGVVVTDSGSGEAQIAIEGGGGGGGDPLGYYILEHTETLGTSGDGLTAGAWDIRSLNNEIAANLAGASLAANVVTLPAGTYFVRGAVPFARTNQSIARLYDVTNAGPILYGSVVYADNGSDGSSDSSIFFGTITLAAETDLRLESRVLTSNGVNGGGLAITQGDVEHYQRLEFVSVLSAPASASQIEEKASASENLLAADAGKYLRFTAAGAKTLTVQPNATEPLAGNSEWEIRNAASSGILTIAEGAGVTINRPASVNLDLEPGANAILKSITTDELDFIAFAISNSSPPVVGSGDVTFAVISAQTGSGTGSTSYTSTAFSGIIPKAAILIGGNHQISNDASETPIGTSVFGIIDGSNQRSISAVSNDNVASTNDRYTVSSTEVLRFANTTNYRKIATGSLVSGGIDLNFTTNFDNDQRLGLIPIGGDDAQTFVGTVNLGTGTSAVSVSGVGFEPDAVIFLNSSHDSDGTALVADLAQCIGIALNDGSQRCTVIVEDLSSPAGEPYQTLLTDAAIADLSEVDGSLRYKAIAGNFGPDGFDVTPSANSLNTRVYFLALKFTDRAIALETFDTPTATGLATIGGAAFTPRFALAFTTNLETVDVIPVGSDDLQCGFGSAAITADDQVSASFRIDSGADPTDTASLVLETALLGPSATACDAIKATFDSFVSGGVQLNFSSVQGTAKKGFVLLVE